MSPAKVAHARAARKSIMTIQSTPDSHIRNFTLFELVVHLSVSENPIAREVNRPRRLFVMCRDKSACALTNPPFSRSKNCLVDMYARGSLAMVVTQHY